MLTVPPRLSRARILVVDDAELQVRVITAALEKAGFTKIEAATDGYHALEKTQRFEPDLVILDVSMPNLDGFGYCERVRGDKSLPRMPIIIQTALEARDTKLRALSCGADDFLYKPVDAVEIALRARIHLERYFMMKDMNDMCIYLGMEREEAQTMLQQMSQTAVPALFDWMNRHCETLDAMQVVGNSF